MDGSNFLLCLEKLEVKDMKDRKERDDTKEKLKRKSEVASNGKEHPNSNRKVKTDRDKKRNRSDDHKTTQNGKARFCSMCKMSGAPYFVVKSHDDKDCTNKGQYEKLLSGGAGKKREANNYTNLSRKR